jgi:hypothetical protein
MAVTRDKEANMSSETMDDIAEGTYLAPKRIGTFKKVRATICKHCPACKRARKKPDSVVGKILHHSWHSNHCPVWKAYNEVYGESDE